jgi:C1A family cysteine protease
MKKVTFLTLLFTFSLFATVFAQKGFMNPSAKYAEILGYEYKTVKTSKGDVGMVKLPNGKSVDAWDFFKGKVAQEYSYPARYGFEVQTKTSTHDGYTEEYPVCVRMDKGKEVVISLQDFMAQSGHPLILHQDRNLTDFHNTAQEDPNFKSATTLPTSFDWRSNNGHSYIGAVRDQGTCGDCYAFGASACAEGTYNVAMGKYDANTADFSEGYIAWCLSAMSAYSSHFSGCNGADYSYSELQALCDVGTVNESYFPYSQSTSQTCPSAATNAPKTKFSGWHRVACSDENAIKTAIMTYGVVDAAIDATAANFQTYTSGVYTDTKTACSGSPCENTTTDHAISLVGWGTDPTYGDYWIMRNSWGSSWGIGGYMYLSVNCMRVACSVCYMTYAGSTTVTAPTATTSAATGITQTGATINASVNNNNAASTTVTFNYGTTTSYGTTVNAVPNSVTGNTATSVSAALTGLTANTTYHYRVVAVNSAGTTTSADATFTTGAPVTSLTLPLTENFNASTMPTSWTTSNTGTGITERWSISNTANAGGTAYEAMCTYQNLNPATTMLITPAFTTTGVSSITISAKYMLDDYGTGCTMKVQVSKDKTTWTDAGWSLASASNTNKTGTISATFTNTSVLGTGTTYVAFVATGNLYQIDYWYVDNVSITAGSTPPADTQAPTVPTGLASSSITSTSCKLSWTASTDNVGVTSYDIYKGGVLLANSTTNSYSVTGLTASTTYSFTVKAKDLAGNVSAASTALSVTTSAATTTPVCTTTTGISVAASAWVYYTVVIPSGATNLVIGISGGTGDADLYTQFGANPTTSAYLCRPYVSGNTETCTVAAPSVGTYYIGIRGYSAATGVTLSVCYNKSSKSGGVELQYIGSSVDAGNTFEIYPNPADDFITVEVPGITQNAVIYDINGRVVMNIQLNGQKQIDIHNLHSGIYTIRVNDEGKVVSKRFVKN